MRKFVPLILFFWVNLAFAANPTVTNTSTLTGTDSVSSRSGAHVVTAGSNLLLISVHNFGGTLANDSYNAVDMTCEEVGSSSNNRMEFCYTVNPPTGSNTLIQKSGNGQIMQGSAWTISGADQTTPLDGVARILTTPGAATSFSQNIVTTTANDLVGYVGGINSGATSFVEAGTQVTRTNTDAGSGNPGITHSASDNAAGAGTYSLSVSWTTSKTSDFVSFAIKLAAAASTPAKVKTPDIIFNQ